MSRFISKVFGVITAVFFVVPVYAAFAAQVGDDGLHKADWMRDTFKDLREDLEEANAEGKRLALIVEQRGCIYCTKMHEEVFSRPEISQYIHDNFFVVQINLHGETEVTDFDGETLTEKDAARKWGVLFTPSMIFFPEEVDENKSAHTASVAVMPGAFGPQTTLDMLTWVRKKYYDSEANSDFQRYHAEMVKARQKEK